MDVSGAGEARGASLPRRNVPLRCAALGPEAERSALDRFVAAGDADAARLGGLPDRDREGEHAAGVVGFDLLGVEGVAEKDLAREGACRAFVEEDLGVGVGLDRTALGADGEDVCSTVRSIESCSTPGRSSWT